MTNDRRQALAGEYARIVQDIARHATRLDELQVRARELHSCSRVGLVLPYDHLVEELKGVRTSMEAVVETAKDSVQGEEQRRLAADGRVDG